MRFVVSGKRRAASVLPCTWSPRNISWPVVPVYPSNSAMGLTCLCDCQLLPQQYIQLLCVGQKLVFASSGAASLGPQPKPSTGGVWLCRAQKQWLGYGASVSGSNCTERLQTELVQRKQWAMPGTLSSGSVLGRGL